MKTAKYHNASVVSHLTTATQSIGCIPCRQSTLWNTVYNNLDFSSPNLSSWILRNLFYIFVFLLGNKFKKTFSELIYFPKLFCFRTTKDLNILDRLTDWLKGITMQNLKWFNWVCPTVYSSLVCMHLICRLIMNNNVLKSITLSGFECSWLHP